MILLIIFFTEYTEAAIDEPQLVQLLVDQYDINGSDISTAINYVERPLIEPPPPISQARISRRRVAKKRKNEIENDSDDAANKAKRRK